MLPSYPAHQMKRGFADVLEEEHRRNHVFLDEAVKRSKHWEAEMKKFRPCAAVLFIAANAVLSNIGTAQQGSFVPNLQELVHGNGWSFQNRDVSLAAEGSEQFVRFDAGPGVGIAWADGRTLSNGVIEVDLRGKNVIQKSFLGVAFHGVNDSTFECIYFRPFNFRRDDSTARGHAVQYICAPSYSWHRLRTEHPGVYENRIQPPPEPDGWFHARIVLSKTEVSVFVNNSDSPALEVHRLSAQEGGLFGLMVGDDSGGDFKNVRFVPEK